MAKKKKISKINLVRLKAAKKVMRETTHAIKPMIVQDKKKVRNKIACRKSRNKFEDQ